MFLLKMIKVGGSHTYIYTLGGLFFFCIIVHDILPFPDSDSEPSDKEDNNQNADEQEDPEVKKRRVVFSKKIFKIFFFFFWLLLCEQAMIETQRKTFLFLFVSEPYSAREALWSNFQASVSNAAAASSSSMAASQEPKKVKIERRYRFAGEELV